MAVTGGFPANRRGVVRAALTAAIALTLVLYVWPLTLDVPLVDPDEGLHAAIAQEMLDRGDAVVPRLLGEPFPDKPVLYFWALMASLRAFGASEPAVRLPGLAFGWLGALTTALLAWQIVGRRAAAIAFCLYATSVVPFGLSQVAVHDVALVPWTTIALLFLWRADRSATAAGVYGSAALAGVFVGLAILTKGLAGVALVGLPFAVYLLIERRLTTRLVLAGAVTVGIGVCLAAPWFLAMERAQPGYLHYFFVERHVMGFATTTQTHGQRPWWYYLPVAAGGAWPWVLYVPLVGPGRPGDRSTAARRLLYVWIVTDLVILSLAGSKLVTYLMPIFPAIAMLGAMAWDDRLRRGEDGAGAARSFGFTAAVWLHALVGVGVAPAALTFAGLAVGVRFGPVAWIGCAAIVGAYLAVLSAWRRGRTAGALARQVGTVAATYLLLMSVAFGPVAEQMTARSLGRWFNTQDSLPPRTWVADERLGSVLFYLDAEHRVGLTPARIEHVPFGLLLGRLSSAPLGVAVVVAERDVARLERAFDLSGVPFDRAGRHRVYQARALRARMLEIIGGR
jgi:4-amino-4-deoxy-L-arabinose transferase-like glycosyltransferase